MTWPAAGRLPEAFGIESRINLSQGPAADWAAAARAWRELGATHLCFNTMGAGLGAPEAHVDALRRAKKLAQA